MTSRAALDLLANIATDDYGMQSLEVQEAIDSLEVSLALLESFKEAVDKVIEKLNHKLKATEHAIYAAEMNGSNTIMLEGNKQIYSELLFDINSWLKSKKVGNKSMENKRILETVIASEMTEETRAKLKELKEKLAEKSNFELFEGRPIQEYANLSLNLESFDPPAEYFDPTCYENKEAFALAMLKNWLIVEPDNSNITRANIMKTINSANDVYEGAKAREDKQLKEYKDRRKYEDFIESEYWAIFGNQMGQN